MKGGKMDWQLFYSNPLVIIIIAIIVLIIILAIFRSSSQYFGLGFGLDAHIGDLRGSFRIEAFDNQDSEKLFVMYYADWCGHCQRTKPEFEKLKNSYNGSVKVMMINAEADEHKDLIQRQNIQGFPTIRYYPSGLGSNYTEYSGNRQSDDFLAYLGSQA